MRFPVFPAALLSAFPSAFPSASSGNSMSGVRRAFRRLVHGVVRALLDVAAQGVPQRRHGAGLLTHGHPLAADQVVTAVVLGAVDPLALAAVGGERQQDELS